MVLPLQRGHPIRIGALFPPVRLVFSPPRGPGFWIRVLRPGAPPEHVPVAAFPWSSCASRSFHSSSCCGCRSSRPSGGHFF
eukprot:4417889-Pyramimonas_sp.AAC.1